MTILKIARGLLFSAVVSVIVLGLILPFAVNQSRLISAAPPAQATAPPPLPDNGNGSGGGSSESKDTSNGPTGAIRGRLTDLSTGQPGAGITIRFNGEPITTDSDGSFSITGRAAGTYRIDLELPGGSTPGENRTEVFLQSDADQQEVNLTYYSQQPPTSTPLPPTPTNTPVPVPPTPVPPTPVPPTPVPVAPTVQPPGQPDAVPSDENQSVSNVLPETGNVALRSPVDGPTVWIAPSYVNNEVGTIGVIQIGAANITDFGAFQALLKFDPSLIEVDKVNVGDFFDNTDRDTTPLVTEVDNTTGEVSIVAYTSGDGASPNSDGTIATVAFVSKRTGFSDLQLNDVRVYSSLGDSVRISVFDGLVVVPVCFGDLTGDRFVDVGDVQIVAGRTNQSIGDPNYVAEYDVNSDGEIDSIDVTIISDRLYQRCQ